MEEYALIVMNWVKNPQNWAELLDFIAGFFGITSANGRIGLAVALLVAGIIALYLVIVALRKAWHKFALARVILIAAIAVCADFVTGFKVSNFLDITSMYGRIGLAVVIGFILVVASIKNKEEKFSQKLPPGNNPVYQLPVVPLSTTQLQNTLIELNDSVFWVVGVLHDIHLKKGENTLIFEWLSTIFTRQSYDANLKGSLEGRVRMSGAEVKYARKKVDVKGVKSDKIFVTVLIPAGYFKVNFDLSDVDDKSYAGLLTRGYTPEEIRKHFDEQCPNKIREFIENNDLIGKTKEVAEKYIKSIMLNEIMHLVEPAEFVKYDIEVVFQSQEWEILRGINKTPIATVSEKKN